MPENDQSNSDSDKAKKPNSDPFQTTDSLIKGLPVGLRWIFIGAFMAFLTLLLVSVFHPSMTERVKFFTVNALSLFVLAAIAVQALIYRKQSNTMERQWKAMTDQLEAINRQEEHMATQAEAVKTQAETMRGQLDVMRGQLTAQEAHSALLEESIETAELSSIYANRAYITARIEGVSEFQFHLRIENTGKTPANNVRIAFNYRMNDKPPYDVKDGNMVVSDAGFPQNQRLGLIAPGRDQPILTPKRGQLDGSEGPKWMRGEIKYYCWGRISYEDIFSKKRHTDFAFFQARGYPNGYPCEHGNSAI
jgi:hypothetical protein